MIVIEKEVFICQWTQKDKKTGRGSGLPVLTKEMQGGNINAFRPQAINLIHLTKK